MSAFVGPNEAFRALVIYRPLVANPPSHESDSIVILPSYSTGRKPDPWTALAQTDETKRRRETTAIDRVAVFWEGSMTESGNDSPYCNED